MAIIIAIFVFLILVHCSSANDFLSKFHQETYKEKDFRIEVVNFNKDIVNSLKVVTFKYNRTTPAANLSVNFKVDVYDKLEVLAQGYKFASNEYRTFPIRFQVNVRKLFLANVFGIQAIKACGNVKDAIFLKNITYYFCNFHPNDKNYPPLVPTGLYKVELNVLYLNQPIILGHIYGEIYIPIKIPSRK